MGRCACGDLDDVDGINERMVALSAMALAGSEAERKPPHRLLARGAREGKLIANSGRRT
jgi:hypothetical protein